MSNQSEGRYIAEPGRSNPEGSLDGAWRIRRVGPKDSPSRGGCIVARFQSDGRDACERWAAKYGHEIAWREEAK
jgi:hypothetical protein